VFLVVAVVLCLFVAPATSRLRRLQREPVTMRRELIVMRWVLGVLSLCLLIDSAFLVMRLVR
jgi:hypothetical protein